ncbi:MAG: lipopolysaccharide biosynthesis protein [bacterium]|nr:MAG: lipopolysaccharide biosynthesis protein [bacterium]
MSPKNQKYFNTDHLKPELKRHAVRGAGATIFSNVMSYAIQMIGTIVLARLLSPDDFGLITMITAFSILFQNFGMRGFTEATVQAEEIDHRKISTLFWIHLAISLTLALAFIACAPLIARFYKEPRLVLLAVAISTNFLLFALATQHLALLTRNMQFYRIAGIEIVANILSVTAGISLALKGASYWSLVARRVSIPLGMAIGAWILCRWLPGLPAVRTGVGKMVRFGMNTYGNFTLNYLSRNLDKVLIGWRHGAQSLGFYDRAYYLFVMPVNQLSYPLTNVAVSALSRLRDDPAKFRDYYLKSLSMLALIGMPLSAGLTLAGRDFILLLLGPQWGKAGEIFTLFGPAIGIILIYGTHGWLHLSLGRADRWFRWGIFELVITALFFMMGLPFGASGVAVAYVLSIFLLTGPGLWYGGKPIGLSVLSMFGAIWKFTLSALAAGLISWYLLYFAGTIPQLFAGLNVFVRIVVASIVCSILYFVLLVISHGGYQPIRQFLSLAQEMVPGLSRIKRTG